MAKKICNNGHKYSGEKCPYCPGGEKHRCKTRLFGTTIRETVTVLQSVGKKDMADKSIKREQRIILCRMLFSLAMLAISIIFYIKGDKGTATGLIGTITGYWLK
jgi:hypothetical protein